MDSALVENVTNGGCSGANGGWINPIDSVAPSTMEVEREGGLSFAERLPAVQGTLSLFGTVASGIREEIEEELDGSASASGENEETRWTRLQTQVEALTGGIQSQRDILLRWAETDIQRPLLQTEAGPPPATLNRRAASEGAEDDLPSYKESEKQHRSTRGERREAKRTSTVTTAPR